MSEMHTLVCLFLGQVFVLSLEHPEDEDDDRRSSSFGRMGWTLLLWFVEFS